MYHLLDRPEGKRAVEKHLDSTPGCLSPRLPELIRSIRIASQKYLLYHHHKYLHTYVCT
jgi:hypothetical protein